MTTLTQTDANRVIIFDTTLRDGEQSPGCSMNLEEKLAIASLLDTMGVDVIEAGFPIASNGDFEAVRAIAQQTQNATVAGLCRAAKGDIDRAWEALQHAASARIHTFISTSPVHMKYKLRMEPEDVLGKVTESVAYARNLLIRFLVSIATCRAALAKLASALAYITARALFTIKPKPSDVCPALTMASTSPPCAPTPGTKNGIFPVISRSRFICSGHVAPTTMQQLPLVFHCRLIIDATLS